MSSANTRKVLVIIRTKNEEKYINLCINKILLQKNVSVRILIIDNQSIDNTLNIANRYNEIEIYHISDQKFSFGGAINLGIDQIRNEEFVLVISAHSIPKDNFMISNFIKKFESSDVNCVALIPKILPHASSPLIEQIDTKNFSINLENTNNCRDNFTNICSFFKSEIFQKIKFTEIPGYAQEDKVWAKNIYKIGYKIAYSPLSVVFHSHDHISLSRLFLDSYSTKNDIKFIILYLPRQLKNDFMYFFKNKQKFKLIKIVELIFHRIIINFGLLFSIFK